MRVHTTDKTTTSIYAGHTRLTLHKKIGTMCDRLPSGILEPPDDLAREGARRWGGVLTSTSSGWLGLLLPKAGVDAEPSNGPPALL